MQGNLAQKNKMDIKQRIQELSLDDKAKLYFMGLVRKGEIDTLPENPKAAYIKMVMDKADPSTMHDDPGDIRIDHDYYAEEKKEDYNKLKEIATELGYLGEEVDEQGLDIIGRGINTITNGGLRSASVSDEGDKIKVKFRSVRREFEEETWETILEYLSDNMGYEILDQSNNYEENYDREEPPEQVPMIILKK